MSVERWRVPAVDPGAVIGAVNHFRAPVVTRCVTGAAVGESLGEVAPAIGLIDCILAHVKEGPAGKQRPISVWPGQPVLRSLYRDGRARHEEGIECGEVAISGAPEVIIRKGRIEEA